MKLAIMQPYFLPYLGYWQLIAAVDKFVVYDDVNFIKNGWINRNRILCNGNVSYLTIPLYQASPNKLIYQVEFSSKVDWRKKISKSLQAAYGRAPEYKNVSSLFEAILYYEYADISDFLVNQITVLCDFMKLNTRIQSTSKVYQNHHLRGQERVIDICRQEAADTYINPFGGRELYSSDEFSRAGIDLKFLSSIPTPYQQKASEFVPGLSIVDILMNNKPEQVRDMLRNYQLVPGGI
ncbi:WbqC family protein [Methylophaga sp. OBS1]|uniref:WbqC family protein n=1 Tax=Methylophaga sp. OBS1 TaxID=2991933 RepID=UPI0022561583|nr:WbqC family protein [Methylophaga sp. OBS1]MCX4193380.1 WbqC family protein [Methylophaga sp. OBS1]